MMELCRSREQKVPNSIPRLGISVDANFHRFMLCAPLDCQYAELSSSASDAVLCTVLVCKMWGI